MSYLNSRSGTTRRGGLLGIVIAVHAAIGVALLTIKSVAPQLLETPLIVDLLQPVEIARRELPKPAPAPAAKPQTAAAKTPQQAVEATTSSAPAPSAPAAVAAAPAPAQESLTQARFDADYLRNPAPPYPALSRRGGEEGKVILRVAVSPQGTAESVEIRSSSGSSRLDDAAASTVKSWKFIPAKRGTLPVHSWVLVPIIFRLE